MIWPRAATKLSLARWTNSIAKKVKRVVLCSGKIYYELMAHRRERRSTILPVVRIEQLYPFPRDAFRAELAKYPNINEVVWCQEEPRNQGAWYWFASRQHLVNVLGPSSICCWFSRPASASPAVGYYAKHSATERTDRVRVWADRSSDLPRTNTDDFRG